MPSADQEVLTSLPDKRPTRRSTKRAAVGGTATRSAPATKAPKKPRARPAAKAPAAPATKPKKTAAANAAKDAVKRPSKVGVPKGQSAPKAASKAREETPPTSIPAAGWATNDPPKSAGGGFNTDELMGTAMTAVTQIAQIGLASVSHSARSLLDKLPRP
jgi:hypothetical protein